MEHFTKIYMWNANANYEHHFSHANQFSDNGSCFHESLSRPPRSNGEGGCHMEVVR